MKLPSLHSQLDHFIVQLGRGWALSLFFFALFAIDFLQLFGYSRRECFKNSSACVNFS